ncbi:ABC transporter permease [Camelliibacillus cellulosilyticus]|uniref:ABC transporter permease n=1 Tax=Camelliibacillus cellulosilyticus TaxID=2174486 RepID=A0ABV9GME5_9BACL
MEQIADLWEQRRGQFWTEASRYLRLLANSGFMFTIYFIILISGVYYQRWLAGLSADFPTEWMLTVVFALLCFRAPIRTFVLSADLVFLLPVEEAMKSYFRKARAYNFFLQSVPIVFVWAIAMPLFLKTVDTRLLAYFLMLVLLLGLKAWNIDGAWREHFVLNSFGYKVLRAIVSVVFIGLLLFKVPWWLIVIIIAVMAICSALVFWPLSGEHLLKWEKVLESEDRLAGRFYRFANLITDVPKMQNRVKQRRWLTPLTNVFPYEQRAVFQRFYAKTFIRTGDYFGIWVRLTVIGALLAILLPKGIPTIVVLLIFVYLTAVQLLGLWRDGYLEGPATLFPVNAAILQRGFLSVLAIVLLVQSLLIALIALAAGLSLAYSGISALVGIIFSVLFVYGYAASKIRKATA